MAEAILALVEALIGMLMVTLELFALVGELVAELVIGIFVSDRRHRAKAKWQSTSIGKRIAAGFAAVVFWWDWSAEFCGMHFVRDLRKSLIPLANKLPRPPIVSPWKFKSRLLRNPTGL